MEAYSVEEIKKLYQEVSKIRNEAVGKANDLWDESEHRGSYPQEIINEAMNDAWNKYFSKLEEIYPGCLSSKEFANFFVENGFELTGYTGKYAISFIDRFSGEGKEGLMESFDFYDHFEYYGDKNHKAWKTLENDLVNGLTDRERRQLGLNSNDVWFSITAAEMPIVDEEGQENVHGFRISIEENEYDEEGNPQAYSGPVGIFVPLDNFKDARIDVWNKRYKESDLTKTWVEKLMPVIETLQVRVPYKSIDELIDMVITKGYEGIEVNKESKMPSEGLNYSIEKNDTFKNEIQAMAEQSNDKPSDLKQITGRLEDKEQTQETQIPEL